MNEFDYLAEAKTNMEIADYSAVISLCDKALKINKNLPEAYSFRGNAKYELEEYDEAVDDFSAAIDKEPEVSEHYYDRSWAYHYMDKDDEAILDINKAIELNPQISYYYYDKGRFEYWLDRYREAIVSLTKGIELKPTENKYIFRANCYMELGEFDFALSDYNSAIKIDPEFATAYYRRGILYKRTEQLKKAEEDFLKALELNEEDYDAMIELGFIRIQAGKKDAIKYFNKAIKVKPSSDNYYWRVKARQRILIREDSVAKLSAGKFAECNYSEDVIFNKKQASDDVKDLNKAIKLDSDSKTLHQMRADRLVTLQEYSKAIEDYNFLTEKYSDNHSNYKMRAFCNLRIGLYQEALDDCKKSVELNDGCADVIIFGTRGLANYKLGNFEKALTDFNQRLDIEDDAETYYFRGLTNYRLKNYKKSFADFKKVLEINPDIESEYDEKIPAAIKFAMSFGKGFSQKKNNNAPIGLCQLNIK